MSLEPHLPTHSPSILAEIRTQRVKDVAVAKLVPGASPEQLQAYLSMSLSPPLVSFVERLRQNPTSSSAHPKPSLVAEFKRSSPATSDDIDLATQLDAGTFALHAAIVGASVISVVTEPTRYNGSLIDLRVARDSVASLPERPAILCKDLIIDEYQIDEARFHGADSVSLAVAALPLERLEALYSYSKSRGMEPLVEVSNLVEMEMAINLGAKVIGINNRNPHSYHLDLDTTIRLAAMVKENGSGTYVLCAMGGITTPAQIEAYASHGVNAIFMG
ncbi:indole-3-glycerol phosphate synthase, partial [Coprinopsis marcescibilis]